MNDTSFENCIKCTVCTTACPGEPGESGISGGQNKPGRMASVCV